MNKLLQQFLDKSTQVGNNHEVINHDDFKTILTGMNFEYINLPQFQITKDISTSKEGITNAIVEAQFGIAETGTLVLESKDENLRRATCLSENLHIVLNPKDIKEKLEDIAGFLEEKTSANSSYIAFITGASRTADIERELTIGVHGPKTVTVHILDDLRGDDES